MWNFWDTNENMSGDKKKIDVDQGRDRIAEMMFGKVLFITGGTGFMGKVLIEKLLRICGDLDTIYILVRVKKGKDPQTRIDEIFNSEYTICIASFQMYLISGVFIRISYPNLLLSYTLTNVSRKEDAMLHLMRNALQRKINAISILIGCSTAFSFLCVTLFEGVRNTNPESIKKLRAIPGDVLLPDLGISAEDRTLLAERVNIVYHCAATIRFDEPLKKAVILNTRGTKLVLELAEEFKQMDAFIHVSTAYCHLKEPILQEKIYEPPADPHQIIKCVEYMDEALVQQMQERILKSAPNTYAYTKALSEGLVAEKMDTMPCLIARPSVVIPIWKDPIPGWTDNINGPTGILIGAGKGVIRTMWCKDSSYADFLPVDIAVNALLLMTWNYLGNNQKHLRVYNLTSSSEFKVSWSEIIDMGRKLIVKVPLNGTAWYPGGSMKKNWFFHQIALILTHWIPAYFLDCVIYLAGHKPFMVRVQDRIVKGMVVFEYYANNQWDFVNDNILNMRPVLTKTEANRYIIDGTDMNLLDYFENCIRSARIYILKDMPDTLPAARRHMRIMYWVDVFFKVLFWYLMWYMFTSYSETAKNVSDSIIGVVKSFVPPSLMSSES